MLFCSSWLFFLLFELLLFFIIQFSTNRFPLDNWIFKSEKCEIVESDKNGKEKLIIF